MGRGNLGPGGAWTVRNSDLHRYAKTPMEHRERPGKSRKKEITELWMDFLMASLVSPETAVDRRMERFHPPSAKPPRARRISFLDRPSARPLSVPAVNSKTSPEVPSAVHDASHNPQRVSKNRPQSASRSRGAERAAAEGEVSEDPSVLGVLEEGDEIIYAGEEVSEDDLRNASGVSNSTMSPQVRYYDCTVQTEALPQIEAIKSVERDILFRRPRHWSPWEPSNVPGTPLGRGLRPGSAGGGDPGLTARTAAWALQNLHQATKNVRQVDRIHAIEVAKSLAADAARERLLTERALKKSVQEALELRKQSHKYVSGASISTSTGAALSRGYHSSGPNTGSGHTEALLSPMSVGYPSRPFTAPEAPEAPSHGKGRRGRTAPEAPSLSWALSKLHNSTDSESGSPLRSKTGEVLTLDDLKMGVTLDEEDGLHPVDAEEVRRVWSPKKTDRLRAVSAESVRDLKVRQDVMRRDSEKRRLFRDEQKRSAKIAEALLRKEEERLAKEADDAEELRRYKLNQMFVLAKELEAEERAKYSFLELAPATPEGDGEDNVVLKTTLIEGTTKSLSGSLGFPTRTML